MWRDPSPESLKAARLTAAEGACLALLGEAMVDDPRVVSLHLSVAEGNGGVRFSGEFRDAHGRVVGGFEL